MGDIKKFQSAEEAKKQQIEDILEEIHALDDEVKTGAAQFDLKLNNGGEITKEDVKKLFSGLMKKNDLWRKVKQLDTDDENATTGVDDAIQAVAEMADWEQSHKK